MVECRFRGALGYKGIVDEVPGKQEAFEVDLRKIFRKLGFLIVQLGDFKTENQLLEPLLLSVEVNTGLVLMPEFVWKCRVRSIEEFQTFWGKYAGGVSHLVLTGHGATEGLIFGSEIVESKKFGSAF
jgi:hypothetical protein